MPRLREFYGSFKSVCDNLRIDLTEFEQIFGANESSFQIWDTDENGYIDSLELFSGLTLMSNSEFEKKIECKLHDQLLVLFHLFDFNEEGKLTLRELEFLIDCSMLSIFKIYNVKADLDRENIASFIYNNFSEGTEITCKRLLTWCSKSSEFQKFFKIVKKDLPKPINSIRNPFLKIEPLPLVQCLLT